MARRVQPSSTALATEWEAQQVVWRQPSTDPADPNRRTDEEQDLLCLLLNAVSDAVDQYLGGTALRRVRTERYDGGSETIVLRYRPVQAITQVRELGQPLQQDRDYGFYPETGALRRLPVLVGWWPPGNVAYRRGRWAPYPQAVEVTYEAGWAQQRRDGQGVLVGVDYAPGGEAIRQAVLLWIMQLWAVGPSSFSYLVTETGQVLREHGMPPHVRRLLAPYLQPAVVTTP